jgi:hypothetical protein
MWGGKRIVIDFVDKTSEQRGTPINRKTMLAVQGFENKRTIFNPDGTITETNQEGHSKTMKFNSDGTITETFIGEEKTIEKTFIFEADGTVTEVIS